MSLLSDSQQGIPGYSSRESLWKVYFASDKGHNFALFFLPCCFWLTPYVALCVIFIVTYNSLSGVSCDLLPRGTGLLCLLGAEVEILPLLRLVRHLAK